MLGIKYGERRGHDRNRAMGIGVRFLRFCWGCEEFRFYNFLCFLNSFPGRSPTTYVSNFFFLLPFHSHGPAAQPPKRATVFLLFLCLCTLSLTPSVLKFLS